MPGLGLSIVFTLLASLTLISALPAPASLKPRTQYCANSPTTVAGTMFQRRALPVSSPLPPRANNGAQVVTWCAPSSATYIIVSAAYSLPGAGLAGLLEAVSMSITSQLQGPGDTVIPTGQFSYLVPQSAGVSTAMHVWNINNHQTTWGVLGAAIEALNDYFKCTQWAAATFYIWDGLNEVGMGVVGLQET
ncbi:hypothetical protein MMC08_000237 [Hypocenomyce scalaris]|nr:hypothetical protein [Hypocenomyce scalaris]